MGGTRRHTRGCRLRKRLRHERSEYRSRRVGEKELVLELIGMLQEADGAKQSRDIHLMLPRSGHPATNHFAERELGVSGEAGGRGAGLPDLRLLGRRQRIESRSPMLEQEELIHNRRVGVPNWCEPDGKRSAAGQLRRAGGGRSGCNGRARGGGRYATEGRGHRHGARA